MADQATQPAEAGNGQDGRAAAKAAVLAEIETLKEDSPGPNSEGTEEKVVPPPDADPAPEPSEEITKDEPAPADDADDADLEPTKPAAQAKADPDLAKRLDVVQKAQKRAKEELARERAELERERERWKAEWNPRIQQAEQFLQLAGRAKYDPVGVLLALGLTEDDLEPAARQVYAHSKAAAADPRYKESATRVMRERQVADELAQTRKELTEMRQQLQAREQAQAAEREAQRYMESVVKVAGEETPLVRTMLAKNAERTRERLAQTAMRLIEESGETPDPEDVVKALEQARRAELEELGIDLDTAIKAAPKKATPVAGETKAARTLTADLGTPAQPRAANRSRQDERADVLRALETGHLE